jgi:hypothetical protein
MDGQSQERNHPQLWGSRKPQAAHAVRHRAGRSPQVPGDPGKYPEHTGQLVIMWNSNINSSKLLTFAWFIVDLEKTIHSKLGIRSDEAIK